VRIAIDWLRNFVTVPGNTQELGNILTMLGLEADYGLDTSQLGDIIIGQVNECIKHPNADKLSLCKVYDGKDTLQVVCGAFNVNAGQKIAFAPVGAVLPGAITITKVKIRGEESLGMICSEKELGISEEHDGIMVLNKVAKVGTSFINYLHNYSEVLELDITPNRPDCFSHFGIARDLSVKTGSKMKSPENQQRSFQKNEAENWIRLKFENENDCPRYIAGIVQNVKVGPSPRWLKDRLESIGQRSINNLVDISNYVMMDIGHPTHIFDYDKLGSKEILIRRGKKGEKINTLDEIERKISPNELLITNGKKPIAIAGIMGGLDSAVNENTSNVLIESAYFEASIVRKGAKSLGMSTDASKRFERGADPIGAENAFWRVIDLLEEIAGGKWIPGVVDPYPKKINSKRIVLTRDKLDLVSGCDINDTFVVKTLTGLGCTIKGKSKKWTCVPPSWRPDLEREVDLIEEVIRMFGFDNVPTKYHYNGIMETHEPDPHKELSNIISILTGLGFIQVFNNSLQSKKIVSTLDIPAVKVMNPLSDTMSHLRTSLIPGLLETADYNLKNGTTDVLLFEWGNIFCQEKPGLKGIVEKFQLTGIIHGNLNEKSLHRINKRPASFLILKGLVDTFLTRLKFHNVAFNGLKENELGFLNSFTIKVAGNTIGYIGDISSKFSSNMLLDLKQSFGFQFDLNQLLKLLETTSRYKPVINFPLIQRDLNFVMDEKIQVGKVNSTIQNNGKNILLKSEPLNIFRQESLGKEKKSVAFNLVFQSSSKTLEDKDVNPVIDEIIRVVSKKYSAKLR